MWPKIGRGGFGKVDDRSRCPSPLVGEVRRGASRVGGSKDSDPANEGVVFQRQTPLAPTFILPTRGRRCEENGDFCVSG
jgi:hypothetical protein